VLLGSKFLADWCIGALACMHNSHSNGLCNRFEGSHHAEGLVDPNLRYKKTVTGFRYPRACRIRKYQIENWSDHGNSAHQLFSKRDLNS
jgi:hypothetical protein